MSDMRTIIEKMEAAMKPLGMVERQEPNPEGESDVMSEGRKPGYRPKEFGDRKVQRQIEASVSELKALAKKGTGSDIAEREQKIFDALEYEMKRNPMNFLMSMLNVLGAGSDYKRKVMKNG